MEKIKRNPGIKIVFFIILLLVLCENILRLQKGALPLESLPANFNYAYSDIHKRFFNTVKLDNREVLYRAQRKNSKIKDFLPDKAKNTRRIFVVGGSVAMMFNQDVVLQGLLGTLSEDLAFEVIGCGMGGYDSYRDSLVFKEILNYKPDLIIVMSGNNEFFTPVDLNLFFYKINRFLRKFWIYRLAQNRLAGQEATPLISPEERADNFQRNLEVMLRKAKKKKVQVAFCTLPVNFRDAAPIGDRQPLGEKNYFFGWYNMNEGNFEEAAVNFKDFISGHPQDAFAVYFLAKCYDKIGDYSQAKRYYLDALSLNASHGDRCIPEYNKAIRGICSRSDAVLIDLEKEFMDFSPDGLVGDNLFMDNCHWWNRYNSLVYAGVIKSLYNCNNPGLKTDLFCSSAGQSRMEYLPEGLKEKTEEGDLKQEVFRSLLRGISTLSLSTDNINERSISLIEKAYRLNPEIFRDLDFLKKRIFRELSENSWVEKNLLDNIWPFFLYHLGESYRRFGLYGKAAECFNEVIAFSLPGFWPPFLSRGLTYHKIGMKADAERDFSKAAEISGNEFLMRFYKELINS